LGTISAEQKSEEQKPARLAMPKAEAEPRAKKLAPRPKAESRVPLAKEVETITTKLYDAARDVLDEVDEDVASELEDRFDKGEHDVFVQKLYERRTKRTVKQLAERYEHERSLRTRVDSYVRLFERLLDTVSGAPNGNQMVEACLGSDTGKVYMMLAEVSGRIMPN
jgi:hypothetical protein